MKEQYYNEDTVAEIIYPTSPSSTSANTECNGKNLKNIINLSLFLIIYTNVINIIKLM